jgi:hypothetical protein
MNTEKERLKEIKTKTKKWRRWGPYLTERQWGTVREDYSPHGTAWEYISHDMARSKAYRWGEEGIAGISDDQQLLCFALSLWNKKDPILKERLFGLTGTEGNHGEDVKECYYYLDSTPSHSYMKMLYKYPHHEFPYQQLLDENRRRTKKEREFELTNTGIFDNGRYFDVFVEYAKADENDILIKISIFNRGAEPSPINVLPTLWFRNTWSWGYDSYRPEILRKAGGQLQARHQKMGAWTLYHEGNPDSLFCDNDTNVRKLYDVPNPSGFFKDGIHEYLIQNKAYAVNIDQRGTKVSLNYDAVIDPTKPLVIRLRLTDRKRSKPFVDFNKLFELRISEANEFYADVQSKIVSEDIRLVQRQCFAGMMWSKQFYYIDIPKWIEGDPGQPAPPDSRKKGRNHEWVHLNNADIISMPDKWEYPWYAAWDLAFHCIPISMIDPEFAKNQLVLLTHEWYMHPNGQLPAYEWAFGDVNPPVHAWATWRVYNTDKKKNDGTGDVKFLKSVFHKLLLNFTWWVNRKDSENRNIFQGGFLGLDNIGVFDRSSELPTGGHLEQADGTSWMAMYSLNMMRIALELSLYDNVYEDMATKFFEHFLLIAGAMANVGEHGVNLWDEEDQFFYDVLHVPEGGHVPLKVRSMVGLTPMFAVEILDMQLLKDVPEFEMRLNWFLKNRPELANLVSHWQKPGVGEKRLLSLLRGHRLKMLLKRMLDETEFLSDYGIRALSKAHETHPYEFHANGNVFTVSYQPGESESSLFGGNSNWRGPIWMPMNYMLIASLYKFHSYYGNDFKVEYPTHSGQFLTLAEIADELGKRLTMIFVRNTEGYRAVYGNDTMHQNDPYFKDCILFYEYFHGDAGHGVGAAHQTGWTGLIAKLLDPASE